MMKQATELTRELEVKKLPNGKWMHPLDSRPFDSEEICRTDYSFSKSWQENSTLED